MKELNEMNTSSKSKLSGQNLDYCIKIMRNQFLVLPSHLTIPHIFTFKITSKYAINLDTI